MNLHIKEAYLEQISAQFKTSGYWVDNSSKSIEIVPSSSSLDSGSNTFHSDTTTWFDINSLIDIILIKK